MNDISVNENNTMKINNKKHEKVPQVVLTNMLYLYTTPYWIHDKGHREENATTNNETKENSPQIH